MKSHSLGWHLCSTVRLLGKLGSMDAKKLGMERAQLFLLKLILDNPGINQEELSEQLDIDKSTTAKCLKKMVDQKLISKKRNPRDKRCFSLYPATEGLELQKKLDRMIEEHRGIHSAGLSREEEKTLMNLLDRIDANVLAAIEERTAPPEKR